MGSVQNSKIIKWVLADAANKNPKTVLWVTYISQQRWRSKYKFKHTKAEIEVDLK
jgi:hypothetical protein